jgi:peptidoglycan/LPS O-acetylase OafA/YrhL
MLSNMQLSNEKYPALTGVRFVGAAVIFFDHFPVWPDAHLVINVMAFFYALSGFLIVRIYYEQAQLTRGWLLKYFSNRFARIYPVYFLLLSVAICFHRSIHPGTLITNYTLTHALFYGSDLIIQPSWSLTVEECFYFLAPVFMLLARRRGFAWAFALGWLLLLAALVVSKLDIVFLQTPMFVLSTTFFGHFAEFFAGVYLALAVMRLEKTAAVRTPGGRFTLAGFAGVLVFITAMLIIYRHADASPYAILLINNLLIPVPIAVLYWGLIRESTVLSRLLAHKFVGLLGRSSYSFYLLHTLVIDQLSAPLLQAVGHRPAVVYLTFVITWILSILLFMLYEEPLNLLIRRKLRSKDATVGVQATLFQLNPQPRASEGAAAPPGLR